MKNSAILIALFAAFALIAGCAQNLQQPPSEPAPPASPQILISIVSAPSTAAAGSLVQISWRVASSKMASTTHTAIHYGYSQVASDPTPAKYAYNSEILKGKLPGDYTAGIKPDSSGTLYYRAHVIADGKSYWTDEQLIAVSGPVVNLTDLQKDLDGMDATVQESISDLDTVK
jgi:hypothetical protein